MRYFFEIAYHGGRYHGWQRQENANTIQETVESCLSTLLKKPISIIASGRTDTGVHCRQQYFHVDINDPMDSEKLKWKLNRFLPGDIVIKSIDRVNEDAHARFDAVRRSYEYRISTEKDPFNDGLCTVIYKKLDISLMNDACRHLVGEKDFECFSRKRTDVNTFICKIFQAGWEQNGDLIVFQISANRFLRGMVRAIVGTMLEIGEKKLPSDSIREIIESKNRQKAGTSAPAEGLFLTGVEYPENILNQN